MNNRVKCPHVEGHFVQTLLSGHNRRKHRTDRSIWTTKVASKVMPVPLGPSGRRQQDRRGWKINMERLKFNAGDQLCIDCTARFRFIENCKLVSSVFLSFLAVLFDVSCYLLIVRVTLYLVVD